MLVKHVVIRNITKHTKLSGNAKAATSFLDQLLGLHRKSNPRSLLFRTRFGIHTFFLDDVIDVVILDTKNRVVKIKKDLQPHRVFFWNPRYPTVLELPKNTMTKSKTSIGDTLSFSSV